MFIRVGWWGGPDIGSAHHHVWKERCGCGWMREETKWDPNKGPCEEKGTGGAIAFSLGSLSLLFISQTHSRSEISTLSLASIP